MAIPVQTLTAAAFAPFGRVIELPARERDAEGPGWRWWAETALLAGDGRPYGVGFLDLRPTDRRFDWAERHFRTQEAMIATSRDLIVYVGPADHLDAPTRLPSFERFRAFRIPAGSGVVLDRAVWHGAPFAADEATTALVLILEGTGRHDVTLVRFEPVEIAADGASS